ncbi:pre-toxin TG domain-containing protein [Bacillus pacificus]
MEGVDPDTGEKLSWWERTGADVMFFAGLTPVGKGIKVVKGAKKSFQCNRCSSHTRKTTENFKS